MATNTDEHPSTESAPEPTRRVRPAFVVGAVLATLLAVEVFARLVVAIADPTPELMHYNAFAEAQADQIADQGPTDVVFVGSSAAAQGFDPTVFEALEPTTTAYNAGVEGGTTRIMERWIPQVVLPDLEPTTVVWGLTTLEFSPGFGEDNLNAYTEARSTRTGVLAGIDRATSSVSTFIDWRRVLRDPSAFVGQKAEARQNLFDIADASLSDTGQRRRYDVTASVAERLQQRARLEGFEVGRPALEALIGAVQDLRDRNIDLTLVLLPTAPRLVAEHPNGADDVTLVAVTLEELANELGVDFINFASGWDDEEFVDYTHLSAAGAERFTTEFHQAWDEGT